MAVVAVVVLDLAVVRTRLLASRVFWLSYVIIVGFQLLVNGLLTGHHIVNYDPDLTAEGPSRVTYELEETDGITKVTTIHDDFPSGSKVYDNVAGGWPYILSGLKTLVETGSPLKTEKAAV